MKLLVFTLLVTLSSVYAGWFSSLPCKCRLGNLNRIVKGEVASVHSMPWMASLGDLKNNHFCGATIINENWILTAAHCTNKKKPEEITVRVGVHDVMKLFTENIYVAKNVIQGDFKAPGDFGDFALIELERPIKLVDGEIEPGCLNLDDQFFPGDLLSAGWGRTARPWKDAKDLKGPLNQAPKDTYELKYYFSQETGLNCKPHDVCVEAKNDGDSACSGDSGGPLMHTKNGKTSVIGMASFVTSNQEGDKFFYCVGHVAYTRLSMYKDLVKKHVGDYCKA